MLSSSLLPTARSEQRRPEWHFTLRGPQFAIIHEEREPIYHWVLKVCQEVKVNANWKRSRIKICQADTLGNSFAGRKIESPRSPNASALGWRLTRAAKYPTILVMRLDDQPSFTGRCVLFLTCSDFSSSFEENQHLHVNKRLKDWTGWMSWAQSLARIAQVRSFFLRKPPNTIWGNDSISTKTRDSRAWGRPTALQVRMKRSTSARQQNVWQSLHTTNTGSDIIVISQVIQIIHGTWVSMENLCKREHCFLTNQTLNSSCLLAL